jgi:hypothetical protein
VSSVSLAEAAQDVGSPPEKAPEMQDPELPYSPYATGSSATRVYWGDTHLHTSFSMDAGAFGNRLGLDEAYRFARGEEVQSTTAGRARLARPLDFLVIADHSDNMGFFPDLNAGNETIMADPKGREWYDKIQQGEGMAVAMEIIDSFSRGIFPDTLMYWPDGAMYRSAWDKTIASAYSIRHTGWVSTPFRWDELAAIDHTAMDLMSFKDRWADVGDLTAGIDEAAGRLEPVLEMVAADEANGIGDAPWPPHYPKMPGEPPRVQPSKKRAENWE